jgi:hypothetical protein
MFTTLSPRYLKLGNKADSITNYRRSLELNPGNETGREALKGLGAS